MAWCAAEMKPSKACLAGSTLFPAKARISGGTSKRSLAAMITSCKSAGCGARQGGRIAAMLTSLAPVGSCATRWVIAPAERTVTGIGTNPMRIVDIRECAVPVKSDMRNSSFDFSEMTTSVVAVVTDVARDGRPVVGFAFNSTGRYACGAAMRARFIPRILGADPRSLLDEAQANFDPEKVLAVMMQREKSGGHSERSIAIGTIEVAVWDAVAKIAEKPLHRVLAERYNGGKVAEKVFCYVGGGWYAPGQTFRDVQDEMRRHFDAGYTMVKMKVGGLPLADDVRRVAAVREVVGNRELAVDANCKFDRDAALHYAKALAPL